MNAVRLDRHIVFDGHAETEEGFDLRVHERGDQAVGEGKIVGRRVFGIGVEIAEQVRDIDEASAAVRTCNVMQTGERDAGFGQIMEHGETACPVKRRLSDAVHGLDLPEIFGKVDFNGHSLPPCRIYFVKISRIVSYAGFAVPSHRVMPHAVSHGQSDAPQVKQEWLSCQQ